MQREAVMSQFLYGKGTGGGFPLSWESIAWVGLTWLNLRVKATTFGAELCFSFLFQPQLDSSCKHLGKLMLCTEPHSTRLGSVGHFSKWR